jgi:carotenoid cleavage dioxygenase
MGVAKNRYLEGNAAPVREEVTLTELEVTGTLPDHLDGRYLRNGPNPVVAPDPATYHWFIGTGMVHGVRLRGGRAEWYRNRWVRSAEVTKALGEPSRPGPVHAGFDFAANTHVIGQAGRTFAIVEAGGRPYELTDELDTIGPCDFDGTLPGGYTAHPKRDPSTGELHAMSYFFGWGNKVQYSILGADARVRRTVDIEVTGSPMMHDFSLTEKHVVIYDLPVTFDIGTATGFPYAWNPHYPARVGVMKRESDVVRWFDVEPCYVFHPLNAYDDGDRVVLDVIRHPKMFATDSHGPNDGTPTLDRWTVDLSGGKVLEERLDDRGQEFPRVDERLVGRRHRYGYTVGFEPNPSGDVDFTNTIVKHDLASGRSDVRSFGPLSGVGEFVFVPERPDAAEDEGVLMGYVYNGDTDRSDLVLMDGRTLETVAEVHLPVRVPYGFHGNWIPAA